MKFHEMIEIALTLPENELPIMADMIMQEGWEEELARSIADQHEHILKAYSFPDEDEDFWDRLNYHELMYEMKCEEAVLKKLLRVALYIFEECDSCGGSGWYDDVARGWSYPCPTRCEDCVSGLKLNKQRTEMYAAGKS